jgi:adenylyltransferase/sulfurtransferase
MVAPAYTVPASCRWSRRKMSFVRKPDEFHLARVAGTTLLPLCELEQRFSELRPGQTIYLHCKGGVRSLKAVQFLKQKGFKSVKSVRGGILAWSDEIDPSVPKY